jgi:hypothetical protein
VPTIDHDYTTPPEGPPPPNGHCGIFGRYGQAAIDAFLRHRGDTTFYDQDSDSEGREQENTPPPPTRARGVADNGHSPKLPELARELNLLGAILGDIHTMGVVGEDNAARAVYLSGTSRKLKCPLSALLMGASATGKSWIVNRVAMLFPEGEVVRATRFTPQSLYHLKEPIAHKFVVGGERCRVQDDVQADSTAALRQLRSEQQITKQITLRKGDSFETEEVTVTGPIAFVETTTAEKGIVFPEDLNRGLIVYTNDTEEQTRRIYRQQAKPYSDRGEKVDESLLIARHHAFQSSLSEVDVHVPYVDALAELLPAGKVEGRRAFPQLLTAIETLAFLHQHTRQRKRDRIVATTADYALARTILLDSFNDMIGVGSHLHKVYAALRQHCPDPTFESTATLGGKPFNNAMTRDRCLKELAKSEVVELVRPGKARVPALWKWTGKTLDDALPTVKQLTQAFHSS